MIGRLAVAAAGDGLIERALSQPQAVTYLSRRLVLGCRRCSGGGLTKRAIARDVIGYRND